MDRTVPAHVLVMDDTQEIVDLLRELLEDEGYRISTANYVLHIDRVNTVAPDVIVMDLLFETQLKGWHLLTMARLDRDLARVPIVLCTAALDRVAPMADQLAALKLEFVAKPFDLDTLLRAVERAVAAATPAIAGPAPDGRAAGIVA